MNARADHLRACPPSSRLLEWCEGGLSDAERRRLKEHVAQCPFCMRAAKDFGKKETRTGPEETIDVKLEVAEALHHAHEQGLVHRDMKPSNIMVTRSGQVKVLDFGLTLLGTAGSAVPRKENTSNSGRSTDPRKRSCMRWRGKSPSSPGLPTRSSSRPAAVRKSESRKSRQVRRSIWRGSIRLSDGSPFLPMELAWP